MIYQHHYINGALVNPPQNYEELAIELDYRKKDAERQISVTSFRWIDEEAELLVAWRDGGLTGSAGITEGVPHKIELWNEDGSKVEIFNGYIDLMGAVWGDNYVEATSVAAMSVDWLNDIADSISFPIMYDRGELLPSDTVFVPYVLNSIPNYKDIMIAGVTLRYVAGALRSAIKDISASIAEISTLLDTLSGIIGFVATLVDLALTIASLIILVDDLINLIIGKVKYKAGMYVNTLIERACTKLGIVYGDSELKKSPWTEMIIIPATQANPPNQSDNRILGFLSPNIGIQTGVFEGTLRDLLQAMKAMFNLDIIMEGGRLNLVVKGARKLSPNFTLPDHDLDSVRTNADELVATYTYSFEYDTSEKNTIDQWLGNNYQVTLAQRSTTNKDKVLLKNLERISVPFARARRKTELNQVELTVDGILGTLSDIVGAYVKGMNTGIKAVNAITDKINDVIDALDTIGIDVPFDAPTLKKVDPPNWDALIDARVGMMVLETDIIGVPKILIIKEGSEPRATQLTAPNDIHIKASYLFATYYADKTFAPVTNHAQRYIYEFKNVQMSYADFVEVQNTGWVRLPNGKAAQVDKCSYNPANQLATFVVREQRLWTNNLQAINHEPTGEG